MNDEAKSGLEPLRELSVDDERVQDLRMQISVSGGIEGERLELEATVTGEGNVEGRFENQLTDRAGSFDGQMSESRRRDVIELVASEGFVAQPRPELFPPDTIVGSVQITLAGETLGTLLAAVDPEQVAGTRAESEPTSTLLAMVVDIASDMVDAGGDPTKTDDSGRKPPAE